MEEKKFFEKAPIRFWRGITFRSAELSDLDELVELEKVVWGEESGAFFEQIEARIKTFQRGNFVAVFEKKIVAYISIEYIDDVREKHFSWKEVTDNGFTKKSHTLEGEFVYGINLSVHYQMNGYNLGDKMLFFSMLLAIEDNKKGFFIGSRLPGFASYKKHYPDISVDDYMILERNGHKRDYELKLYGKKGFELIKALPGYFEDPASLNFGALVYWTNPFYGKENLSSRANMLWENGDIKLKK